MGDMTLRDVSMRDLSVKNIVIDGNLVVNGETINGAPKPVVEEPKSELILGKMWKLAVVDEILFIQKWNDEEQVWENKQAMA